ncbi:Gfo/Idh/MocA family protein [Paenibacillus sp. MBLB4367]|uniref:Gfo/Idh/MocA family protein n=1 Tax=Paenibacillus sp. MBLB4367 TaxID=3384767 RepID=UPI0039080055
MMKLGIIGYGGRIHNVAEEIMKVDPQCRISAICDIRNEEIRQTFEREGRSDVAFYESPEELASSKPDGILIGTRCSSHTEVALKVFPSGIPVYMEKPVATTYADLLRLKDGYEKHKPPVIVSFPLRGIVHVRLAKEIVDSGKIGAVEHVQAVNNVPYGDVYFQHWYRDNAETGGMFLQKATHDFDCINYLLGLRPTAVCAMTSKRVFNGSKPAGLTCPNCGERDVCMDSAIRKRLLGEPAFGEHCVYGEDAGNEDSGSAIIRYENGMHASYSQNFFVRKKAGSRSFRLLSYKGTLEFDLYTNVIKVYMHHTNRVESYDINADTGGHLGGDTVLAQQFVAMMRGERSAFSTLEDGMLSALMCLKAKDSAATDSFQKIEWPDPAEIK